MNAAASSALLAVLIAAPVTGALIAFLLPVRLRATAGILTAAATTAATAATAWRVAADGAHRHALGGWGAPLGIDLYADGLSCVFLLMTGIVGLFVSVYAKPFFAQPEENKGATELFWPLWLILWASLNGMFLSADLFNLYVMLEVMGLSAVALAVLSGRPPALVAGLRYLLAAIAGSMAYLMGVAMIYGAVSALDLQIVAAGIEQGRSFRVAFSLILVGLLVKTAVFPLHFWLPGAHSTAQAPVSAILSALVVKASFYLILRLWVDVFDGSVTVAAGQALGALGAAAIIWGSYQALRQRKLKLMVAHSTVGQIGYMFLLFPLITVVYQDVAEAPWLAHAWTGGVYQAIAHGFAKAAMFLAVGVFAMAVGSDDRDSTVGLVGQLPMTTFALALAGVSLIGLPPSGGFVAKWMLLKAAFTSGQWWWAPVILLGSFLTAGYVFMVLRQAFAPTSHKIKLKPVPRTMEVTALVLGAAAIIIGFRAEEFLLLLDVEAAFQEPVEPHRANDR